jgi:hypothetical protein
MRGKVTFKSNVVWQYETVLTIILSLNEKLEGYSL